MEDDVPAPAPQPIIIPSPPSISQTAGESADAQVEAYKKLVPIMLQYAPQLAQSQTDIQRAQAPQLSQINLDQQQQFAPLLIKSALDNLKLADPTGLAVREKSGQHILGQLSPEQFGKLSAGEARDAEQNFRAAQVSRGSGTGLSDSIEEVIGKFNLGRGLQQQQLSYAGSFLAGTPPQASFGSINQAGKTAPVGSQSTDQYFNGLFPSTNALIGSQAQNYGTFADFTGRNNALNSANYWGQVDRTSNPFLEGLAGFGGFVGSVAGGVVPKLMGGR